jgi:hypothetical protein
VTVKLEDAGQWARAGLWTLLVSIDALLFGEGAASRPELFHSPYCSVSGVLPHFDSLGLERISTSWLLLPWTLVFLRAFPASGGGGRWDRS